MAETVIVNTGAGHESNGMEGHNGQPQQSNKSESNNNAATEQPTDDEGTRLTKLTNSSMEESVVVNTGAGHQSNGTEGHNGQPQQSNKSESNNNAATEQPTDGGKRFKKVADVMSENSSAAALWKTALSGSLDEKRLLFGMVVLSLFYIVYINFTAYQDSNSRDEDAITHNCTCRSDHRSFYLAWSTFCYLLWGIIHIILTIPQIKSYFCLKPPKKDKKNAEQDGQDKKPHCSLVCYKPNWFSKQMCHSKYWCTKLDKGCGKLCGCLCCNSRGSYTVNHNNTSCYSTFTKSCTKLKRAMYQHDTIHRYEYYLWTKYYELYVIGMTKEGEKFTLKSIDKFINDELCTHDTTDGSQEEKPPKLEKENPKPEATVYTALSHIQEKCCSYGVQAALHLCLFLVLFLAQLAVIPLLMIQVFDTYAFLCLAADDYCTMESQFSLHFHQTVVTFAFYCSLMVSFLTSTMLHWVPWPRKDSQQK